MNSSCGIDLICLFYLTSLNCDNPGKVAPVTTLYLLVYVEVPNPESGTEEPPFFPLPLSAMTFKPPITDKRSVPVIK